MKKFKKAMALILSALMVSGCMSTTVYADEMANASEIEARLGAELAEEDAVSADTEGESSENEEADALSAEETAQDVENTTSGDGQMLTEKNTNVPLFSLYARSEQVYGYVYVEGTDILNAENQDPQYAKNSSVEFHVLPYDGYEISSLKITDDYLVEQCYETLDLNSGSYRYTFAEESSAYIEVEFSKTPEVKEESNDISKEITTLEDESNTETISMESETKKDNENSDEEPTVNEINETEENIATTDLAKDAYTVKVKEANGGKILINGQEESLSAPAGTKVYICVIPNEKMLLSEIYATDNDGNEIELKTIKVEEKEENGTLAQQMFSIETPASDINIGTKFIEKDMISDQELVEKEAKLAKTIGGDIEVKYDGFYDYGRLGVGSEYNLDSNFTIDDTYNGYCLYPWQKQISGTFSPSGYEYCYDPYMISLLYYGYGGQGQDLILKMASDYGLSDAEMHIITHLAVSSVYNGGYDGYSLQWSEFVSQFGIDMVNEFKRRVGESEQVNGSALIIYGGSADYQDVISLISVIPTSMNGSVTIYKTDNNGQPLKGAVFALYEYNGTNDYTSVSQVASCDDGTASFDLERSSSNKGCFMITEVSAPDGYKLDTSPRYFTLTENGQTSFTFYNSKTHDKEISGTWVNNPITGKIQIKKESANLELTDGNGCYSLEGAIYGVYTKQQQKDKYLVGTITTDAKGKGSLTGLDLSTYYVREITASKGYGLDDTWYEAILSSSTLTVKITSTEPVDNDPFGLKIEKINYDYSSGISPASLEGTQFSITHYGGYFNTVSEAEASGCVKRTWIIEIKQYNSAYFALLRDEALVEGSDPLYKIDGVPVLPNGTVVIEETKAADGYTLEGGYMIMGDSLYEGAFITQIKGEGSWSLITAGNAAICYNRMDRGDFAIIKTDDVTGRPMADVEFKIINTATGEERFFKTDENGYYSSSADYASHSAKNGMWFGESDPDDTAGALTAGTYRIEELRTLSNMFKSMYIGEITINGDKEGSVTEIKNYDITLQTTASSKDGGKEIYAYENQTVTDSVEYTGLTPTHEYRLEASLIDKATKQPVVSPDGTPVGKTVNFTCETENGSVEVEFDNIDASALAGHDLVVYEELYDTETGLLSGEHKDLNSASQTVKVILPEIETTAADKDGNKVLSTDSEVLVTDTINYSGLQPGGKYVIEGVVMSKTTGQPITDSDGNKITGRTEFTANESDGVTKVDFTFTPSETDETDFVIFETLHVNNEEKIEIAEHTDINSKSQSLTSPTVETQAMDADTGSQMGIKSETEEIIDTLHYTGLKSGETYKITGYLVLKKTGEKIEGTEKTESFTPESSEGDYEMHFTYDSTDMKEEIVVFEKLYRGSELLAAHCDINSTTQNIYYPSVETKACDAVTGSNTGSKMENAQIKDTIEYSGLVCDGRSYHIEGILMDKASCVPLVINGQTIKASTSFTPTEQTGTVEVTFTLDSTELAGKTVVVFEEIHEEGGKLIAQHTDINSDLQSVRYPDTGTTPATGDNNLPWAPFLYGSAAVAVALAAVKKNKKSLNDKQ